MNRIWQLINQSNISLANTVTVYNILSINFQENSLEPCHPATVTCGKGGSWIICIQTIANRQLYSISKNIEDISDVQTFNSLTELCDSLNPEWKDIEYLNKISTWNGRSKNVYWPIAQIKAIWDPSIDNISESPGIYISNSSFEYDKKSTLINKKILSLAPETTIENDILSWSIPNLSTLN